MKNAGSLAEAIRITKEVDEYTWLRYRSLNALLENSDYTNVWACAELLKKHEFPWRKDVQKQIRDFDAGKASNKPSLRMLEVAVKESRCDLVESILEKRLRPMRVGSSVTYPLLVNIEQLRPVAHLIIPLADLSSARVLGCLLDRELLPLAIPYLAGVSSHEIASVCRWTNVHMIVANGLCSYEEAIPRILEETWGSSYPPPIPQMRAYLEGVPPFVDLARQASPEQPCWYWHLYASDGEREEVVASVQHLRELVAYEVGLGDPPQFAGWTHEMLDELPRLPFDIISRLLRSNSYNKHQMLSNVWDAKKPKWSKNLELAKEKLDKQLYPVRWYEGLF